MATPENPMVIGALLLFDRRLTLDALEEVVRRKLVPHRRFRQHVVEPTHRFGRPYWCDDSDFALGAHVQKLNPPKPVDAAALFDLVSERMSAPLSLDRSPWSLELADLVPAGSALLVRIHHCIADGRALVSLLEELAEDIRNTTEAAAVEPRSSGPGWWRRLFGQFAGLLRFLTLSSDPASLLRRPLGGRKRVAWSQSIPVETIKRIARARGHHVADVLLAGVAGALDRYGRDHGQPPRSLRALLPVSVPSQPSADGLGNRYASVFVRLPTAAVDPQARFEAIARDMAVLRTWGVSRLAVGLTRLAGALAPAIERRMVRWWSRRASLVVSSLAGPTVPLQIGGQPLGAIVVWAPAPSSIALSLTFFGYAGALRLGVLADAAVIARPQEIVAAFEAAIDELGTGRPPASG